MIVKAKSSLPESFQMYTRFWSALYYSEMGLNQAHRSKHPINFGGVWNANTDPDPKLAADLLERANPKLQKQNLQCRSAAIKNLYDDAFHLQKLLCKH